MGKRGYNPMEKQSSTMSNAKLFNLLAVNGFELQVLEKPIEAKKSVRHAVLAAQRAYGENVHISASGESVFFTGQHVETKQTVNDIRVKLSNMLGIGERDALYKLTGIPELKVTRD